MCNDDFIDYTPKDPDLFEAIERELEEPLIETSQPPTDESYSSFMDDLSGVNYEIFLNDASEYA